MSNYNKRLDKTLESVFMAGLGIAVADDISPEEKDTAILNTQKFFVGEAKQALTSLYKELVAEAKPKTMPSNLSPENYERCERVVNQYHQNLLKALEDKK